MTKYAIVNCTMCSVALIACCKILGLNGALKAEIGVTAPEFEISTSPPFPEGEEVGKARVGADWKRAWC